MNMMVGEGWMDESVVGFNMVRKVYALIKYFNQEGNWLSRGLNPDTNSVTQARDLDES